MAPPIRFYLDENVPVAVAAQLQRRGVDAVTVRDLGFLGDSDRNHLVRATSLGYVLCTNDADYVDNHRPRQLSRNVSERRSHARLKY